MAPTAISDGLLLMLNSQGTNLDLWDCKAKTKVLSVVKKGDNLIQEFAFCKGYFAYSDAKDTQIFYFNQADLQLTKLT